MLKIFLKIKFMIHKLARLVDGIYAFLLFLLARQKDPYLLKNIYNTFLRMTK